jgi:hypothetical protein
MAVGNRGWPGDIYIPRGAKLTPEALDYICRAIREMYDRDRREQAERRKLKEAQRKRKEPCSPQR